MNSRLPRRAPPAAAATGAVLAASGCVMTNSGSPEPTASCKVTPDADLFAQIKALLESSDSNIHFIDKFGWGRKYEGTIFVAPDTTR